MKHRNSNQGKKLPQTKKTSFLPSASSEAKRMNARGLWFFWALQLWGNKLTVILNFQQW